MIIELGEKLKALRIENHLRQDQVARLVNVEKSSISMYETGVRQPSYITLVRLADVFNVSTDYLLGRKNSSPHRSRHNRQKGREQTIQIPGIRTRHNNLHNPRRMVTRTIQQIPRHSPRSSPQSRRRMIPQTIP